MRLLIDNLDGRGLQDYTAFMAAGATIVRKLNSPAALKMSLVSAEAFTMPVSGARVQLVSIHGNNLFTGYLATPPCSTYAGWHGEGPQYRYDLCALSDVTLLDQKAGHPCAPFVARSAGDAFRQLTLDAMPGWFDLSGVEAGDTIPYFTVNPSQAWMVSAAEIALAGRCSYRDDNGKLFFSPLAQNTYALAESDPSFSPGDLKLQNINRVLNDLTVLGQLEPAAHVKDYFVGDGYTSTFYLSQIPFTRGNQLQVSTHTILNEEYTELDPMRWSVSDPRQVISVSNGQLQVAGGTGTDGQTCLTFIEKVELGGATVLEHGDVVFNAASDGVIGGLYRGAVSIANCVAGFRITRSGANCNIQALVGGGLTGAVLVTQPTHHYVFTTRLYPTEIYRMEQVFHSSLHPSGSSRGGNGIACDVRVVLEVHDIDPANPATQAAPATVLYDGVINSSPGFCTYALINAAAMWCSITFTYLFLAVDALVRSTLPQQSTRTRRVGSLRDGAECHVSSSSTLQFYPEYIPAANETVEVTYRSRGHAMARVMNSQSIAAHKNGADDGTRGSMRHIAAPAPRRSADCEIAALAVLDDAGQGWVGEYQAWGQFLPDGAQDIFAGDGLAINIPSRAALFLAVVNEVAITLVELAGETLRYTLRFVDAGDPGLDFTFATALMNHAQILTAIDVAQVGRSYVGDLTNAEATTITSTTVTIDVGYTPGGGGGIEVRYSDTAWGAGNNRNLLGRFTSRTFTLPRYARAQDYFLRSYDSSSPAKYSRYSTALHVDYPLT